ncbi:MAG: RepB family DNA primase [Actinomycetota bacterium]|nr:RepB family DNA primase [Actinomycetota bacterium]
MTGAAGVRSELSSMVALWEILFEDQAAYFNTFTGQQARFTNPAARANELARVVNKTWKFPEQAEEAAAYLLRESQRRRDAYFGVHQYEEYQPGRRLAANAVEFVHSLWVDGDGAKVLPGWLRPGAVVYSSEGREHFYWPLSVPIHKDEAARLNKRMAVAMGADKGKAGLATVLRAPGTFNYKRETPELVTLEITGERYSADEISAMVPELPGAGPRETPRRPKKTPPWANSRRSAEFDLVEWMILHGVPVGNEVMDGKGRKWRLLECPIAPPGKEHSDGVYIGHHASGAPWFQCYHDHGEGFTWRDVRPIFEPDCYVPWWVKAVTKNG